MYKIFTVLIAMFVACNVYAGTPLESTAVNQSLKSMLSTTGKWKRILVSPGSEAQVRSDLGVEPSVSPTFTGTTTVNDVLDIVGTGTPAAPLAGTARLSAATGNGITRVSHLSELGVATTMGRDSIFTAKNTSGSTINKGQVVYVTGTVGAIPTIALAKADATATSGTVIGIAITEVLNNAFTGIMLTGVLESINTSAFTAGDVVYVSAITAGSLTNVKPAYPNYVKGIGTILNSGVSNGSILINLAPFLGNTESGTDVANYTFAGNVGVGTTTPSTALHVIGTITATSFSGNGAQLTGKENTLSNSAGLAAAISDETGTGVAVFGTSPNFTSSISIGNNAATTGEIRLLNSGSIFVRNAANNADISALQVYTDNALYLGYSNESIYLRAGQQAVQFANNTYTQIYRNLGLNTLSFGTATGVLAIANGTITGVAAIAGQGMIACESGELKAMDASGNITPFSPHSELDNLVTNLADPLPHTYVSTNSYLGKKKIVNMAVLIEEIEKLSGKTLVTYEDVPLRNWTTDQDAFRVQRDLERLKKEAEIDEINLQIAEIDNQLSVVEENKKKGLETSKENLQKQKANQNKTMPDEYIPQHPPKWMQDRGVTLNL